MTAGTREMFAPPRPGPGSATKWLLALVLASAGLLGMLLQVATPGAGAQDATAYGVEVVELVEGYFESSVPDCPPNTQGGTGSAALGGPDDPGADGSQLAGYQSTSLGRGGSITIRFGDFAAGDGDTSTPDVWVWETGIAAEPYLVEVSEDGSTWVAVGNSDQSTFGSQGFDVDHAGFTEFSQIAYIRVTDTNPPVAAGVCRQDGPPGYEKYNIVGSDIDAVGVISRPIYAALELDKESDVADGDIVEVGDIVTYTFTVENTGTVDLTDVVVNDPLPGISETDPASADIAAGGSATFTATYTVTQDDVDAGQIVNRATTTGDPPPDCTQCEPPTSPPGEEIIIIPPDPALTLDKESDVPDGEFVELGDTITYTFTVENTGNVTIANVTVDDPLPGLSATDPESVASLAPGDTTTFTATYVVTAADIAAGEIANAATTTGDPPPGCEGAGCDPTSPPDEEIVITEDPDPALTIDKESDVEDGGFVGEGDTITYTFTVTNTGNVDLTNVTVDDPLEGLSAIDPASADLAVGESATFTATYVVTAADVEAGQIVNAATTTGEPPEDCTTCEPPTSPPDEEIVETGEPGLTIDKESDVPDGETVGEGDTVTYTFTVTNTGDIDLTNVTVDDPLEGLSAIDPASADIAVGESATFTATYVVSADDVANGEIVNAATSTGDCGEGCPPPVSPPDEEIVTTDEPEPGLTIDKESDVAEGETVGEGDTVTYTFLVTNTGDVALTDVTISDALPGLTWTTGPNVGDLAPGESATGAATYVVTAADVINGDIVNRTTATGDCGENCPPPTSPPDEEIVITNPAPEPGLTLDKTADTAGPVQEGDTIAYTFTVANTGDVTLTDVTVTDLMPGLTWPDGQIIGELAPGESASLTATYTVTADDIAAGWIVNNATATGDCGEECTVTTPPDDVTVITEGPDPTEAPTEVPTEVPTEEPTTAPTEEPTEVPTQEPTEEPTTVPTDVPAEPGLTLDKQANTAGPVPAGFEITYSFIVTNTGNVAIPDVTITDPLPGLTWVTGPNLGALEPGFTAIGTATYIVTEADAAAGWVINAATVDCAQGGCVPPPTDEVEIPSCVVQESEDRGKTLSFLQVEPTDVPVEPTDIPVEPTDIPVEPTDIPVEPTDVPVEPTDIPVEPTDVPVEPTDVPVEPTVEPTIEPTGEPATEDPGAGTPTAAATEDDQAADPCAPPATEPPPVDPGNPGNPGGGNDGGNNGGGSNGGGGGSTSMPVTSLPTTGSNEPASGSTMPYLLIVAGIMLAASAWICDRRRR